MYTYRMYRWIAGERTEVAASGMWYESVDACEAGAREQLRGYLPGTVCEIVETGTTNLQDGPVVKRIGN
jgi:hypothetical protein